MMASGIIRSGAHNEPLNAVLARLEAAVRPVFGGPLTYASLPWEQVDWSRFDIVGVDHYRAKRIEERYVEMLAPLLATGKPVVNTEFGNPSCVGGDEMSALSTGTARVQTEVLVRRLEAPTEAEISELAGLFDQYRAHYG